MVPCLHSGYLDFWWISSNNIYLESLSYTKKQQELQISRSQNSEVGRVLAETLTAEPLSLIPTPITGAQ